MISLAIFPSPEWLQDLPGANMAVCERMQAGQWVRAEHCNFLGSRENPQNASAIAILPVECVTCGEVLLPPAKRGLLMQSLPYLIEDDLLPGSGSMHYAMGPPNELGRIQVVAIEEVLLERLQHEALSHGVTLKAVHIDAALLPEKNDSINLLYHAGRWLCRQGGNIWSLRNHQLSLLTDWCDENDSPILTWHLAEGRNVPDFGQGSASLSEVIQRVEAQDSMILLAESASEYSTINLLQGRFLPDNEQSAVRAVVPFGLSLILVALIVSVYFFGMTVVTERSAEAHRLAVVNQFRSLFPDVSRIVDVRKQAQVELSRVERAEQQSYGFIGFLSSFSRAWSASDMNDAIVTNWSYSSEKNSAVIDVSHTAVVKIERLQGELGELKLKTSILSVSAAKDGSDKSFVRLKVWGDGFAHE